MNSALYTLFSTVSAWNWPVVSINAWVPVAGLRFWSSSVHVSSSAQIRGDTMTKVDAVNETPKEILLKDYKAPDYAFEKVFFNGIFQLEHYCSVLSYMC